jgi:hypothetical protein
MRMGRQSGPLVPLLAGATGNIHWVTLIVFFATEDRLVVAADRRLTYPDKSIAENDRTKLLTWCGGMTFGFTGQALC